MELPSGTRIVHITTPAGRELIVKSLADIKTEVVGKNRRKAATIEEQVLSVLVRKYNIGPEDYEHLSHVDQSGYPYIKSVIAYLMDKNQTDEEYDTRFYIKDKPKPKTKRVPKVKKEELADLNEEPEESEPVEEAPKPTLVDKLKEKADKKKAGRQSDDSSPKDSGKDKCSSGEESGSDTEEIATFSDTESESEEESEQCNAVIKKGKKAGELCGRINCRMHNRKPKE